MIIETPVPRFILKFDEFAKNSFKKFMEKYGFEVQTEVEIFKQPKRVDILVVKATRTELPPAFSLFGRYWKTYNLVSYKSPRDRVGVIK